MNLKRSVRKSTRIAVSCGVAVDIMPITMEAPAPKPRDNTRANTSNNSAR